MDGETSREMGRADTGVRPYDADCRHRDVVVAGIAQEVPVVRANPRVRPALGPPRRALTYPRFATGNLGDSPPIVVASSSLPTADGRLTSHVSPPQDP